MSGTRSHLHRAQATEDEAGISLLIVAHGECGGVGDDRLVHRVAERVRGWPRFNAVNACFIRGEPSIKAVAQNRPAGATAVYPLFMSDGYYVKHAIPEYLGSASGRDTGDQPAVRIMRPVGLNPKLPLLFAELAKHAAHSAGMNCREASLLLVAHGSGKSPESRKATLAVAAALEKADLFAAIETGFLEEAPFLPDQLATIAGPVIAVGLFIGEGMHGAEDLPQAIRDCGRDDIVLAEPLSRSPALLDLICDELAEALELSL